MSFPRHPRFRRAETFAPLVMTERDTQILRSVNRHRFLHSHQISELVGGSRQQTLRRLQKLYHHGYLERPTCQLDYYQRGGSRNIVYGLASRGASHLRRVDETPFSRLDWTSRNGSVKRLFLEHALMVSKIMVSLEIACRKRGNVSLKIEHDIPLPTATRDAKEPFRWTVTVSGKEKLGVIPDRVFALEFNESGERMLCFLEADCGTMPVQRATLNMSSFARKLLAYRASWAERIHLTRFGFARARVLTVTAGTQRLENLLAAAANEERGKGLFLFADDGGISSAADILGHQWTKADGSVESLLSV
jgi:DNA-binding Lrp family transcriptional regulator